MCGIAGIFRIGAPPDLAPLDAMRDAQAHRGPDEARTQRLGAGGLATVRLAIVDPARGSQPLCDASGRYWVAMNGEVYNHAHLREQARARGLRFRSTCDTEVVAELVAELGFRGALDRLEGMFGLAVWDSREAVLWVARDRMGEKPLHYTTTEDGTFLFSSELKGLLVHPEVPRDVDPDALGAYLLFEFVPTPRCIYRGIRRLEPGHLLRLDDQGLTRERYWTLPRPVGGSDDRRAMEDWATRLAQAFEASIGTRREADVPVGVVLSGGLDSTAVLALADRGRSERSHTFTVTMPGQPSFDESSPARLLAEHYGTFHHEIPLRAADLPGILAGIEAGLDEPLADSSLVATWWLYQHVHEAGFKAVLSGDGGDELLGGYPTYLAHRWSHLARPLRRPLGRALRWLPVSHDSVSMDYKLRRMVAGLEHPLARMNQVWLGAFLPHELPAALTGDPWREVDAHGAALEGMDPECAAMALDQRLYMGDGVLVKVDRASQANSVEVRTPFLNHEFVALAARCPAGLKLGGRTTKRVWRHAVRHILPPQLLDRPKKGFGTPVGPWLRGPLAFLLDDLCERVEPWMPPEQVRCLVQEHQDGTADHRRRLWSLVILGRWLHGPWGPNARPRPSVTSGLIGAK
jgi:asparagine synthase (glutamine-hydrolysing)